MPRFEVEIPHALPAPEVRSRLDRAKAKLEQDYGATCAWDDSGRLVVTRKGLSALVSVGGASVQIEVEIGLLLSPMSSGIRSGITKQLTSLLQAP
jgi:putative polyhydroxyalkanoate system protein